VLRGVEDVPVEDGRLRHQAQRGLADPPPEDDVLVHGGRLDLGLLLEVENLKRPRLRPEGDDLTRPVHDGAVGLDGPARDVVAILEIDDQDFGLGGFRLLLADANVGVRF